VAVQDGLDADGTFVAEYIVVSQSVPHLHVHVVPRRRKDGLRGFFWPRTKYASEAEMEEYADRLAAALVDDPDELRPDDRRSVT
jgi:histidine triad (HIT) family protein